MSSTTVATSPGNIQGGALRNKSLSLGVKVRSGMRWPGIAATVPGTMSPLVPAEVHPRGADHENLLDGPRDAEPVIAIGGGVKTISPSISSAR